MLILMTAALAAAQPATPAQHTATEHAQHQQAQGMGDHAGQMGRMSDKQMAECHKCCEEMMAKMHEGHATHSEQKAN